ncbi:hypothetical protein ACFE04_002943 [Oxalis oulophora]
MAPRGQSKKNTRADAAYDAMKKYGFSLPLVKKTLKELLQVYSQDGWMLIEEDSYSVLLEAILEKKRLEEEQEEILQIKHTCQEQDGDSGALEENTDAVVMDNESAIEDGNHHHDVSKNIHGSPKSVETDSHLPVPKPQRKPCHGWITDYSDHDEDDIIELTPEPLPESIIRQLNEAGLGHLIEKYQELAAMRRMGVSDQCMCTTRIEAVKRLYHGKMLNMKIKIKDII